MIDQLTRTAACSLTPEEDAIDDGDDLPDDVDDMLPADLWFRAERLSSRP